MNTIFGAPIVVSPDRHRTLPDELVPGLVPWPPGFKDEIDAWMRSFFKPQNILPDNQILNVAGRLHMNPRTYARVVQAAKDVGAEI